MKRWLPLIIFAALAGFFYVGLHLNPREVPSPFIGKLAPAFKLPVVGQPGATFSPEENKGKVWLLNVWAPWCVSCRQEHEALMQLKAIGVPVYGLNWKDKGREAEALLAREGSPYVVTVDDLDGRVGIDYGVTGTPETFIIDKAGIIRMKHIGPINAENWQEKIEPLLKELNK
ncbi:MAG: DsbE family thiol:disulfide interchange protein [Thiobacillus sp.]|nr:DsbE family thiol:disulfide interchange protein [Thiobacillus sp.]